MMYYTLQVILCKAQNAETIAIYFGVICSWQVFGESAPETRTASYQAQPSDSEKFLVPSRSLRQNFALGS